MHVEKTTHHVILENNQIIGNIPNLLSCAHFLATSPLVRNKAVLVIVEDTFLLLTFTTALHFFTKNTNRHIASLAPGSLFFFSLTTVNSSSFMTVTSRTTWDAMTLPRPEIFWKNTLLLQPKQIFPLSKLKKILIEYGYERETQAARPGSFAVRGEVVDIFTTQRHRITFENNIIATIHDDTSAMDTLILPPLHCASAHARLEEYCEPNTHIVTWNTTIVTNLPRIALQILPHNQNDAVYHLPKIYADREKLLHHDAKGQHVTIFTQEHKRAKALLPDAHIVAGVMPGQGFILPTKQQMFLTDYDLGFANESRRTHTRKSRAAFLQTITTGDIVVHWYHGIARCGGLTTMHANGMNREYVILEYAGNDKMYLPVEYLDRLEKYVGSPNPTLQRLGEAQWHETIRRARTMALAFARDMLNIAAARTFFHAPILKQFPHDERTVAKCFPYTLTPDQTQALHDILHDLSQEKPMDRLLVGDVGFGKTEVALRVAFRAVLNNVQVAIICPTTILTQQHVDTFRDRLESFGVRVDLLSRWQTRRTQKEVLQSLRSGTTDIVIGTHRLLSRDVHFKKLGLLIIDEEQRFGVKAKEHLKQHRAAVHVLAMTATPIPRTLHLSLADVRNISTIATPPPNRQATAIHIARFSEEKIKKALADEIQRNGQAYYVVNRIPLLYERQRMVARLLPKARIDVAHGQMPAQELAAVMHRFDGGESDILIATTIIENGLDIPAANTLIVDNAPHFGLAELYQLKGRVGRSDNSSVALFFYNEQILSAEAQERLRALHETQQLGAGFELAMRDMQIRGVGSILGKEQHGHAEKIGLHYYLRLLDEAVTELQNGKTAEPIRDIPIDLPLDVQLPSEYIAEEHERLRLYQRLALLDDTQELFKERDRLMAMWQCDPRTRAGQHLLVLFHLLEIKILARHSPLLAIDTAFPSLANRLTSPRITLTSDSAFSTIPAPWECATPTKIRATLEQLGVAWVEEVKKVLRFLQNQ